MGMMARFTQADVIVVGLIGERGREVKGFINILGTEGLARSVVVAPADVSCFVCRCFLQAHIAEDFRDRGKHVLLIMDSPTLQYSRREIALARRRTPAAKRPIAFFF